MRIIASLALMLLSACTTIVIQPSADSGTPLGDGSVLDAGPDNDAWMALQPDTGVPNDAWGDDAWSTTLDSAPGDDAWTAPLVHCDADELLDALAGRCWSYNVTDGACAPGREVGWWSATDEQARVQTLMASLTTNALVNTALIRNGSGSWVWQGHSGVTPQVNWVSPHPLGTDQHAALSHTGMQADSFPLASGAGTLCVRPGT